MAGLFDGTPLERPVTCDRCGQVTDACRCTAETPAGSAIQPADQHPRVRRERRRGKWNTIVADMQSDPAQRKALLKELQHALGVGGGMSDGDLVLQGDHRDKVVKRLCELGYHAKASGG